MSERVSENLNSPSFVREPAESNGAPRDGAPPPVVTDFRRLIDENEALADEVLRGYEQLNLIFDFTQQIATITSPADIVAVLLARLAKILAAPAVYTYQVGGSIRHYDAVSGLVEDAPGAHGFEQPLAASVARVREERRLLVLSMGSVQALVGGLVRLNDAVDVVVVMRPSGYRPFTAGDALMVESVLTFAGRIISNCELHEQMRRVSMETTRALVAAIDKKDHYTRGHSERVGMWSRMAGRELGLDSTQLQFLEWSGVLHDVGKIGVPESILQKTGRLTEEEFAIVKRHPVMGYEILKPIESLREVLDGVLYHHENPNGTGYPSGLTGHDIPLFARIIHVVDVFDALSSTRSYRPAYTIPQALDILREEAGTKLDADCVAAFLSVAGRMIREQPAELRLLYGKESL